MVPEKHTEDTALNSSTKKFPKLYQTSSTNKVKEWSISVEKDTITISHGYIDGKKQEEKIKVSPKNIGRSNETTPFEQACIEANSKWNKKRDKGYLKKGEEADNSILLPMLAYNFKDRKHDLEYPVFTQPKLNGVRCVVHPDLKYQSRLGKFWDSLGHLNKDLGRIMDVVGTPLDGEAYIHGLDLQDIGALIKKERLDDDEISGYTTEDLEYWLFDTIDEDNFQPRYSCLWGAMAQLKAEKDMKTVPGLKLLRLGKVVLVPVTVANDEEEFNKIHKDNVKFGFEGTMGRNNVPYVKIHRTKHLQKRKEFLDAEFVITGGKEATGRDKGTAVFRLKTKKGLEFECRPIGTLAKRRKYWKQLKKLVGKKATVRFQEWTKDKIPFHGRVVAIRDYE